MLRVALLSLHGCPLQHPGQGEVGGMQVYVRSLADHLARHDVLVDIYTRWHDGETPLVQDLEPGVRLVHLPVGPARPVSKSLLERYRGDFFRQTEAFVAQQQLAYDLVHSHYWVSGWVGDVLRKTWQVPHIVQFHTLGAIKDFAWSGQRESQRRIAVERRLIARADAIIASSYEERDEMVQRYGAARDKVTVIPAGVDLARFQPYDRLAARARLGLPAHARIALYAGRIEPFKGLDLLLEALAALEDREDVLLLIAGGSGEDAEVRRLKLLGERLGLNGEVRFLGTVPHDDLAWYYSAANVCAFPSYYETFGLAALEAMACGTPVVATSAGGLRALVRDGETGYLVPWHCPDPFAERLNVLLRHERLQEAMGRAARARAEEFPWSAVAQHVLSLYRRVVAAHQRAVPT